jgi:hypothetical protein
MGPGSTKSPIEVTGKIEPLPTTMERGWKAKGGRGGEILCGYRVVWLEASESATQSVTGVEGVSSIVLKESTR